MDPISGIWPVKNGITYARAKNKADNTIFIKESRVFIQNLHKTIKGTIISSETMIPS
jgi:hypothetical protein